MKQDHTLLVIWTEQTTTVADAERFLKAHLAGVRIITETIMSQFPR